MITEPNIDQHYIHPMLEYVDPSEIQHFLKQPGQCHYHLLGYLASKLTNSIILDIGTFKGSSAVALATNPANVVYSFDVRDQRNNRKVPFNLQFIIGDLLELLENNPFSCNWGDMAQEDIERNWPMMKWWPYIGKADFIMVDVHNAEGIHNGVLESKFHQLLQLANFGGVAIYDDITLNNDMRAFWDTVTQEKTDVTRFGHNDYNAGTGMVQYVKKSFNLPEFKKL